MTLLDEFVDWYLKDNPVRATLLGAAGFDRTLGDFSEEGFIRRERATELWLDRLSNADPGPSLDDRIDHELALSHLHGEVLLARWPEWRRAPAPYLDAIFASMFTPFQQRLSPEPDLVEAAVGPAGRGARGAGGVQGQPGARARRRTPRHRGGCSRPAPAGGSSTETLPAQVGDPALRTRLAAAAEPAAAAFDDLVAFLDGFTSGGSWRMGEELYSGLLREREMLGYGAAELHAKGVAEWEALNERMNEVAGKLGFDAWRPAMESLMDDHPPTLEAMRAEYEAETERARQYVRDRDLVTFPAGEHCQVLPSPEFQRPIIAVANYLAPPPLSTAREGVFFVPYTPDDFTEEQIRQRLRTNSRPQMPSIAVHEAYPGHHWQLAHLAENQRRIRKVFRTPYFVEGLGPLRREAHVGAGLLRHPADRARPPRLPHLAGRPDRRRHRPPLPGHVGRARPRPTWPPRRRCRPAPPRAR